MLIKYTLIGFLLWVASLNLMADEDFHIEESDGKTYKAGSLNQAESHKKKILSKEKSPIGSKSSSFKSLPKLTSTLPLAKTLKKPSVPEKSKLSFLDSLLGAKAVKPWQKGRLAEQRMKPGGAIPAATKFSRKIYASKENTRGGFGVSGGGCGCN